MYGRSCVHMDGKKEGKTHQEYRKMQSDEVLHDLTHICQLFRILFLYLKICWLLRLALIINNKTTSRNKHRHISSIELLEY